MRITFQSFEEAAEVATIHPMTMEVLLVVRFFWPPDRDLPINEIARLVSDRNWNPKSWHCQGKPPMRAVDISLKEITMPEEKRIVAGVDERFQYDPSRPSKPVAYVHEPRHLHIQTHPLTIRRTIANT